VVIKERVILAAEARRRRGKLFKIIGAAVEVHRTLGPGYLEKIYEQSLAVELEIRDVSFERQFDFSVIYKDREVGRGTADFLCYGDFVVELKAAESTVPAHEAQVISYLTATRNAVGLLLNFGRETLKDGITRVVQ